MNRFLTDALQAAVYAALSGDATLQSMTGGAIHDALPRGRVPELYVSLGRERVRDRSDIGATAALHDLSVLVSGGGAGFLPVKEAAARVAEILDGSLPELSRGRLLRLDFLRSTARPRGRRRDVELWFRAFVEA